MISPRSSLDATDLAAVAALERRVVAADGGRLKLDRTGMRTRDGSRPLDVLSTEDGRVTGYLGIDLVGGAAELAGAVDPSARRRGTGSALLAAARDLLAGEDVLLVVPGGSPGGAALAAREGGVLSHSEHALALTALPDPVAPDPATTLREADPADEAALADVLTAAFGRPPHDLAAVLAGPDRTLVVERAGRVVATLRLSSVAADGSATGLYGFAVHPDEQGRGLGRDVLRRVCAQSFAAGAERVELEVAVGNEGALRLYTSLGFAVVAREDYWRLPR